MKKLILGATIVVLAYSSSAALACGGDTSGKHIGTVLKISTTAITISDAETSSPITFLASSKMTQGLSKSQAVVVDYEENEDGGLNATMISPAAF